MDGTDSGSYSAAGFSISSDKPSGSTGTELVKVF
jgi:hypothetical protein